MHKSYIVREMMFGTREEFEYFICLSCGCLQIADIPHDLARYYPKGYYSHNPATPTTTKNPIFALLERALIRTALFDHGYKLSAMARRFASLPDSFFRARPALLRRASVRDFSASILDIGCGSHAKWLLDLRSIGFSNLTGIDPYIDADFRIEGISVHKSDTSTFANSYHREFDLITLHHSLEHIPNQLSTLQNIARLLKPTGICVIRIPTVSSDVWNTYGINWVELDAPRHLYLHSKDSLRTLAHQVGLDIIDIHYDSIAFEFWGSEQYKLDIPLNDLRSPWVSEKSTLFSADQMRSFEDKAKRVNSEGTGGRACFFLRPFSAPLANSTEVSDIRHARS